MFFTLFLRSFILLLGLECVVGASVPVVRVGSRAKGDQRCARGFAVLQYTRKHGLVRERTVCVTSKSSDTPTTAEACFSHTNISPVADPTTHVHAQPDLFVSI